jgi:tetratricopeptide (TPR) repeat protein
VGADHNSTANAHVNLSAVLALQENLDEAELHARRAIEILEPIEPDTPLMFGSKTQLAYVLYEKEDFESSEAIYAELLALQREKLPAGHPNIARTLHGIGIARLALDLPANDVLQEALDIREAALGPDHPHTVMTREALALAEQ